MKITLIEPRGFCFGVCRALKILDHSPQNAYVLHEIVHNTAVVDSYKKRGFIFVESLDEVPAGSDIVFSAHGVSKDVRLKAIKKNLKITDATCPFVQSVHRWVEKIESDKRTVILIGKKKHIEIIGTLGQLKRPEKAFIVSSIDDVECLPSIKRVGVATQTTFSQRETEKIMARLRLKFNDCLVQSGVCQATTERQKALEQACLTNDTILVVGDKKSANAMQLLALANKLGRKAFLVENAEEVELLDLGQKIAITAAASAPEKIVQKVVKILSSQHVRD